MYLADTLSRTYLPEVNACDLINELEEIDNKQYLVVSEDRWQQIRHASADDPVLQQLQVTLCFFCQSQNQTYQRHSTLTVTTGTQ